ncbi:MAG: heavy metal translocating P-type ATPase [Granulosicoccaceae bacterium]
MPNSSPESCFHCGLPVPGGANYPVKIEGKWQPMCCRGCQAVAQAIIDAGMGDFYKYRTDTSQTGQELVPEFLRQTEVYDNPVLQQQFVRSAEGEGEDVREADLILEGIVCAACVWLNERHLSSLPGVLAVSVNYSTHRARVKWDNTRLHLSDILKAISAIGYLAHPYDPDRQQQIIERERRTLLKRLGLAGVLGMQVMTIAVALYFGAFSGIEENFRQFFLWLSLGLTLPVLLYSAAPFYRAALRDVKRGQAGMDVPVSLGMSIAFIGSVWTTVTGSGEVYYDSVVMFTFFLLTGRYFELAARKKAAEASEHLVHMAPAMATRIDAQGNEQVVPVAELAVGDRLRVRPGESVPADGVILAGRASIDEAVLTGESMPVARGAGEQVIGGSVNVDSPIDIEVEKTGQDTVLSGILRLLDRAQSEKPHITRLADRTAAWFVLAVIVLAVGVAGFWWWHDPAHWLPITVAVLVVTCPCALSLATPTAVTAATGRLTRSGLLATRGHALETFARATHNVFDKTGTLTVGKPELLDIHALADMPVQQLHVHAAALEQHSEHPLARAVCAGIAAGTVSATELSNTPGGGLQGHINGKRYALGTVGFVRDALSLPDSPPRPHEQDQAGHTVVAFACETGWLAWLVFGDRLRDDAHRLVHSLQADGRKVCLLTGDHAAPANVIAAQLGIDCVHAGLAPQDKLQRVREMQEGGAIVAMIGDGVNDAPVLAGAQVSVAMGSGTQLAAASADMILLSDQLMVLADTLYTARKTLRIIRQNLVWAIGYNLLALPAAAIGLIAPWMAALGMSASSLIVVGNALRLTRK